MTFSVIIPMYNAEQTIRRCIGSLLQSAADVPFELIVVDDGSRDASAAIVEGYHDHRIRLIRQSNQGPSAARNAGIDAARNEILCFVDADDYVAPDYLAQLNAVFEAQRPDAVFFGFHRMELDGKVIPYCLPERSGDYFQDLVNLTRSDTFGYTWIKAMRRDFVGQTRFDPALPLYEDEVFSATLFQAPCRLAFLNVPLYHYVLTQGSVSLKPHQELCTCLDRVYTAWEALLEGRFPEVLTEKANHWVLGWKYYGLDRARNTMAFYKDLSRSRFFRASTVQSDFVNILRQGRFGKLRIQSAIYKAKTALRPRA